MQERRQPEIIAGRVNSDGSIATGDGFTVNKPGVGNYQLTFPIGFRVTSGVAILGGVGANTGAGTDTFSERSFRVVTMISGAFADSGFSFIATGTQT